MRVRERPRARRRRAAAGVLVGVLLATAQVRDPAGDPVSCEVPVVETALESGGAAVRCGGSGPPLRGPARLLFGLPIDPNSADPLTLETLPGIGPARARGIVSARRERPFASAAELSRVPGIGPQTAARLAPWLAVAGLEEGGRPMDATR